MRKLSFLVLFLVCLGNTQAQEKLFTIAEATLGAATKFRPESFDYVKPIPGGNDFSYIPKNGGAYDELSRISASSGGIQTIITLKELNAKLLVMDVAEQKTFPFSYEWTDAEHFRFVISDKLVEVHTASGGKAKVLANFSENPTSVKYNSTSGITAFTWQNNVFVTAEGKSVQAVTKDETPGIQNGGSVHRDEFGIHEGIFVSPKGNLVAWYRKDEREVNDYPLINSAVRVAEVKNIKYPMAGMASENVRLGVHDTRSNKSIFINTGEPKDQYLTAVTWDPSEKFVYIGILNRGQNHLKINQYSAETGEFTQTLFEEKHSKWVEPEHPLLFLSKNPNMFIWQSERDGFNHLYLYNTSGQLLKQLTQGEEPVTSVLGFDEKEENLFYQTSAEKGLSRRIYVVNIKSGKVKLLTPESGTYSGTLSANGQYLLLKYTSLTVPSKTILYDVAKGISQVLLEAANPYADYNMPSVEYVIITAADGKTQLNGRLIKPTGFDSGKKYPTIVYVYGGPHAQLVTNSWLGGASLWDYYMAQKGFVVFTVDNRGSANRGLEFENVIHRRLGIEESKDQMKGVEYLKSLSFVDQNKIGVYGWSYGGFMTTTMLTSYPEVFKAGVAGGPVIDWKWYEIMYGERYMDTPDENSEGYAETALLDKADKLKARLLMIHGAQDPVVVQQHSLEFVSACIKAGKQIDYFVYPDHEHNVRGKDRIHLLQKISDYFELHLK